MALRLKVLALSALLMFAGSAFNVKADDGADDDDGVTVAVSSIPVQVT